MFNLQVGGESEECHKFVQKLSPSVQDKWEHKAFLSHPRDSHGLAVLNQKIYAVSFPDYINTFYIPVPILEAKYKLLVLF